MLINNQLIITFLELYVSKEEEKADKGVTLPKPVKRHLLRHRMLKG